MLSLLKNAAGLLSAPSISSSVIGARGIARIPHWEYHIRMDNKVGKKRVAQDVLDRFKRLNNGMWIHARPGKNKQRYMKDDHFQETSLYYETCTKRECEMLDKMMTPFWLQKRFYVDDPYKNYQVRHGLDSPRVDAKGHFIRERSKILMDDTTSLKYFKDR
uniref:39S ribosomal protein L35, mitochondrial n=1 Tax=Rhabditophanes sp. KR3021 TaxID=114890 RepID=A0AC35TSH7_9BILA